MRPFFCLRLYNNLLEVKYIFNLKEKVMFNQKKYSKIKNIILKLSKKNKSSYERKIFRKLNKQNSDDLYLLRKLNFQE